MRASVAAVSRRFANGTHDERCASHRVALEDLAGLEDAGDRKLPVVGVRHVTACLTSVGGPRNAERGAGRDAFVGLGCAEHRGELRVQVSQAKLGDRGRLVLGRPRCVFRDDALCLAPCRQDLGDEFLHLSMTPAAARLPTTAV